MGETEATSEPVTQRTVYLKRKNWLGKDGFYYLDQSSKASSFGVGSDSKRMTVKGRFELTPNIQPNVP